MTRKEKIALLIDELGDIRCNNFDADTDEDKTLKEAVRVIKALEQEPKIVILLEKTYADFCACESGEGWLEIDGKEYFTDVGYAIEGMSIFMKVFKQRLVESGDKEWQQKEKKQSMNG